MPLLWLAVVPWVIAPRSALAQSAGDGATAGSPASNEGSAAASLDAADSEASRLEAQLNEAKDIPDIEKVRPPHSAAFALLGVAPTQIERPSTPTDFGIALTSDLQGQSELTLPRNLAIEIAPYWWFPHRRLTFDQYVKSGWGSNLLRNTTLSIGTASADASALDEMGEEVTVTQTRLAMGLRTQIYTGVSRADVCSGQLKSKATALAALLVKDMRNALASTQAELLLAGAERVTWNEIAKWLAKKEEADKRIEQAEEALKSQNLPLRVERSALKDKEEAELQRKEAETVLAELEASSGKRAKALAERYDQAQQAFATAATEEALADAQVQLGREQSRKEVAEKVFEVSRKWRSITAAEARKRRDDAAQAERRLSDKRAKDNESIKAEILVAESAKLRELVELCENISAARTGWNLSISGALSFFFPDGTFAEREFDAWATWLIAAYTWKFGFTLSGLGRVGEYRIAESERDTIMDIGGRVMQAKNRYGASLEVIVRTLAENGEDVRFAIVGEYMLRKDTWLSISFGKDFGDDGKIFTLANLNWGYGSEGSMGQ